MQRVSARMAHTIEHMYNSSGGLILYANPNNRYINYSQHTVFPSFFRVSLQGDRIELPFFAKEYVQGKLLNALRDISNPIRRNDVIIPLSYYEGYNSIFRTSDALVRSLTEFNSSRDGMYSTVKTNKGEIYHGCTGTIFNKDMTLLIFNVIECEIAHRTLVYKKVKSYVHPSVFYSEGIVEKCIVNKIIPYILKYGVEVKTYNARVDEDVCYTGTERGAFRIIPELSVMDVTSKFFCKPILPSVEYSDDDINDMLNRNIDDVFNIIGI